MPGLHKDYAIELLSDQKWLLERQIPADEKRLTELDPKYDEYQVTEYVLDMRRARLIDINAALEKLGVDKDAAR